MVAAATDSSSYLDHGFLRGCYSLPRSIHRTALKGAPVPEERVEKGLGERKLCGVGIARPERTYRLYRLLQRPERHQILTRWAPSRASGRVNTLVFTSRLTLG